MELSVAIARIFHFRHGTNCLTIKQSTQHSVKGGDYILTQILKKLRQIDDIQIASSDTSFHE